METLGLHIEKADNDSFERIKAFVEQYEFLCVQLCSQLKNGLTDFYIIYNSNSQIWGVLYLHRIMNYCLPFVDVNSTDEYIQNDIYKLILKNKITCISGEKKGSDFILNILEKTKTYPSQKNIYKLMILSSEPKIPPQKLQMDEEIKRCSLEDFDLLFDIQKKYLIKEVMPLNKEISDLEISVGLKQILKKQITFALLVDYEAVSKVNTNAIGFNWVQLGGVYTHPLYRRNYYAWHLINYLSHRVLKSGKNICLFVKEKNIPAIALYQNIGFIEKGAYQILYF